MKFIVVVLAVGIALPALALKPKPAPVCNLELNTEYKEMQNEETSNPATPDSFANLAERLKIVMDSQSTSESKAVMNPKIIEARETFSYGKGANVLQSGHMRRVLHAKAHGCVEAELRIDHDLSGVEGIGSDIGIFNKDKTGSLQTFTDAVIRFSNARGVMQHDMSDDLRGFALKLKNVDGPRLATSAEDERDTQDFLFTNAPTHFAKDAAEMVRFAEFMQKAGANFGKTIIKLFLPWKWGSKDLKESFQAIGNAIEASKHIKENRTGSVLTARYYSRVPFLVGKKAAKFSVTPAPCEWWSADKGLKPYTYRDDPGTTSQPILSKSEHPLAFNILREDMISRLAGDDVCFDFNVQFQVDACKQPIEAADVPWELEDAPVIRVGQVKIPKQVFAGVSNPSPQDYMCERLTFNPWHALEAHKPLGNMNRARQQIYYKVQSKRLAR